MLFVELAKKNDELRRN